MRNFLFALFLPLIFSACVSGPPAGPADGATAPQAPVSETAPASASVTATAAALTETQQPAATGKPTLTPTPSPLPELPPSASDLGWVMAYGLPGDQSAAMIRPAKDGGFILVGNTVVHGPLTAHLLKIRADGWIAWQQSLPQVQALDVLETSAGEIILAGDRHWIKFASDGSLLWNFKFEQPSYHTGPIIRLVEEGNGTIVVEAAGSRAVFGAHGELQSFTEDVALAEPLLTPQEAVDRFQLEENPNEYVFFVQATGDGDALVGEAAYEDYGDVAVWFSTITLYRFAPDGALVWQKVDGGHLGASYNDFRAFETAAGDILLFGTVSYFADNGFRSDVWVLRLDRDGNLLWMKIYATEGEDPGGLDAVVAFVELSNGDLLFAGQTSGAGTGGQDLWILKTNALGEIPNCGLVYDGTAGMVGDFPAVQTAPFELEGKLTVSGATALPLCAASP